jgi:hypothetical protein
MLAFYDEDYQVFNGEPLRTVHNGKSGGASAKLVFIRNDDPANYYTDLVVTYENNVQDDYGVLGSTGWSVKFLYGRRQPTEEEWDSVTVGQSIVLPNIGSTSAADTYTFHPIWIRVYCPGNAPAQIREGQSIRVYFDEKKVGA